MVARLIVLSLLCVSTVYAVSLKDLVARISAATVSGVDITANLQHYWYGANSTNDAGTGGKNLVNVNSTSITTNGFDFGTGTAYLRTDGPISNGTAYTVALWARPDKTAMDAHPVGGWMLSDRTEPKIDWQVFYPKTTFRADYSDSTSGGNFRTVSGCTPTNNTWTHLAWVVDYSSTTQKMYVNGSFYAGSVADLFPNNGSTANFCIGGDSWAFAAVLKYHGLLDKIRFYSTAKNDAFIQAVYTADKASKGL